MTNSIPDKITIVASKIGDILYAPHDRSELTAPAKNAYHILQNQVASQVVGAGHLTRGGYQKIVDGAVLNLIKTKSFGQDQAIAVTKRLLGAYDQIEKLIEYDTDKIKTIEIQNKKEG